MSALLDWWHYCAGTPWLVGVWSFIGAFCFVVGAVTAPEEPPALLLWLAIPVLPWLIPLAVTLGVTVPASYFLAYKPGRWAVREVRDRHSEEGQLRRRLTRLEQEEKLAKLRAEIIKRENKLAALYEKEAEL